MGANQSVEMPQFKPSQPSAIFNPIPHSSFGLPPPHSGMPPQFKSSEETKEQYIKRKQDEEIQRLEQECNEEREKYKLIELEYQKQLADLRQKNQEDTKAIEDQN